MFRRANLQTPPVPALLLLALVAVGIVHAAFGSRPIVEPVAARANDVPPQPVSRTANRHRLAGTYDAEILRVIDGDTVEARVIIWFGQEVTTRIRLAGIDAPEAKGACADERRLALAAQERLRQLVEGRPVRLAALSGDKYFGRVVAELHTPGGIEVGRRLMAEGLAVPYEGRRRTGWCALPNLSSRP
jgi:endonuclease YncB( thermonuclease family)